MAEATPLKWLELPRETEVILVDDMEKLERARTILAECHVCGIDAEFCPTERCSAALVQLAVRRDQNNECVLLVVWAQFNPPPVLVCGSP